MRCKACSADNAKKQGNDYYCEDCTDSIRECVLEMEDYDEGFDQRDPYGDT